MRSESNQQKQDVGGRPAVRLDTVKTTVRMESTLYDALCIISYQETKLALSEKRNMVSVNEIMCEGLRLIVEKKSEK